jgi:hypothetical protein
VRPKDAAADCAEFQRKREKAATCVAASGIGIPACRCSAAMSRTVSAAIAPPKMRNGTTVATSEDVVTTGQAEQLRPLEKNPFAQAAQATPAKDGPQPVACEVFRQPGQRSIAGSGQRVSWFAEAPVEGTQKPGLVLRIRPPGHAAPSGQGRQSSPPPQEQTRPGGVPYVTADSAAHA